MTTEREAAALCRQLKARYPRIDDPVEAINFALDDAACMWTPLDFLQTWRDGAWDEIEKAYPEFLKRVEKAEFCA